MPTWFEFALGFLDNFSRVSVLFTIIFVILMLVCFCCYLGFMSDAEDSKYKERYLKWADLNKKFSKLMLICFIPSLFLSCLPSISDLWKIRIDLLKFQLASPENIKEGKETIERIGKSLECKYVGTNCDKKVETNEKN